MILLYVCTGVNIFLIQPGQERFYLDTELYRIHKLSLHFTLIIGAILFSALILYLLFTNWSNMSACVPRIFAVLFWFVGLAFFSEPAVETTILIGNRQFPRSHNRVTFIADRLVGDTLRSNIFLF